MPLRRSEKPGGKANPYEVVLLDSVLPGMDGPALGNRIKKEPGLAGTTLIMMTSLGQRGDAARLKEIGFAGYLPKPVRRSHLRQCLSLALGRIQHQKSSPSQALITRHTIAEHEKRQARILLVEDNPTNRDVALAMLRKLGFRADVAENGREAVRSWKTCRTISCSWTARCPKWTALWPPRGRFRKLEGRLKKSTAGAGRENCEGRSAADNRVRACSDRCDDRERCPGSQAQVSAIRDGRLSGETGHTERTRCGAVQMDRQSGRESTERENDEPVFRPPWACRVSRIGFPTPRCSTGGTF